MENMKRVELLAPAGNMDAFYGAISAGADAVYLAGERFGARAYAENFTTEEIIHCIRYAHILGRKIYLTVNTLIKENEFEALYEYLIPFYENGLDAVIVQDFGAFSFIKKFFPELSLHVSTQMTITGANGAKLLRELGAERIVPARECSLSEIKTIKQQSGLEIECFIHGAMCYSYSGQCLFSSILGGRSGNRGRCAQPCRLPYAVEGTKHCKKECYPLSLKDMSTIEHIDKLIEAGIDSFKIEGRMKKPEYAAGVTAIYRKYIDAYYEKGHAINVSNKDMLALNSLYIRSERASGYYFRHNGAEMVTLQNPAYNGSEEALLNNIRNTFLVNLPKLPISMKAVFHLDTPCMLTLIAEGCSITITGGMVEHAMKQPVTEESIQKQLRKLGDSCFSAKEIDISADNDIFIPLKAINELRREAVEALEKELIIANGNVLRRSFTNTIMDSAPEKASDNTIREGINVISVQTEEQLAAVYHFIKQEIYFVPERIYINSDAITEDTMHLIENIKEMKGADCLIIISLPYILRQKDAGYLEEVYVKYLKNKTLFSGFQVRSMEALGYLTQKTDYGELYADAGFYGWNLHAISAFRDLFSGWCIPYELKEGEQRNLKKYTPVSLEKIVYGRIPMMLTANCVLKTTEQSCKESTVYLTDRYQKKFPVRTVCRHCMNIIYNSVPLSLHASISTQKQDTAYRVDFTLENAKEVKNILSFFHRLLNGKIEKTDLTPPFNEFTTGHEKRGVE